MAAACGTALSHAAVGRFAESGPTTPAAGAAKAAGEADLRDDLARMGSPREYSEEGVPVFLACVDLVAEQAGKSGAPATPFSAQIAANLRRYGDAWQRLHPDAPEGDVARLIQILAERDFVHGVQGGAA
jgi:hypothetical protein